MSHNNRASKYATSAKSSRQNPNPSPEDHAAFKTLLAQKDPAAMIAWDGYMKSNDQSEFFRLLLKVVHQSSSKKSASKPAQPRRPNPARMDPDPPPPPAAAAASVKIEPLLAVQNTSEKSQTLALHQLMNLHSTAPLSPQHPVVPVAISVDSSSIFSTPMHNMMSLNQPSVAAPVPISVPLPPQVQPRSNPLLQILESSKVKTDSILDLSNQKSQDYYQFANVTSQVNSTNLSTVNHHAESEMLLGFLRKGAAANSVPATPPPGLRSVVSGGTAQPTFQAAITGSEDHSKQKSQALLSLLRPQSVTSPAPKATISSSSSEIVGAPPAAPPSTVNPPPIPVPATSNAEGQELGARTTTVPTANAFPPSAKKSSFYRVTKKQAGKLRMMVRRGGQQGSNRGAHKSGNTDHEEGSDVVICEAGVNVRPGQFFILEWTLPEHYLRESRDESAGHSDLVIGLVRYGSFLNSPCIVSKSIGRNNKLFMLGSQSFATGSLTFHAPKAAGPFVFRLFDQASKESSSLTLGTSFMFNVVLMDFDVTNNVAFILDAFNEEKTQNQDGANSYSNTSILKGLTQFPSIIRGIRNAGRLSKGNHPSALLQECMKIVLDAVTESYIVVERGLEKQALQRSSAVDGNDLDDEADGNVDLTDEQKDSDTIFWRSFKYSCKMHIEAHEVFESILFQPIAFGMIPAELQNRIMNMNALFCPLLHKYFRNFSLMDRFRRETFGFKPSPLSTVLKSSHADSELDQCFQTADMAIERLLKQIVPPSTEYIRERQLASLQLQRALLLHAGVADSAYAESGSSLLTKGYLPMSSELAIYGSSGNNFGSLGADLDMCLLFPKNISHPDLDAEKRSQIIERLGEALTSIGMLDVKTRPTARIPIVEFKDPLNGLECDISLNNQLALRNTKMLRLYSEIDSRVRTLSFVIKHWAQARHCNKPQFGTLSSYGFVLCILHFLQRRPVPLIPNIQALPTDWTGHIPPLTKRFPNEDYVFNNTDGLPCDTYFYSPSDSASFNLLVGYARQNKETVLELLTEFFRYFAWTFDYKKHVVSINSIVYTATGAFNEAVLKIDKAEKDGWMQHDRLSIEDPFESSYDVAHVIKAAQMLHIRKEFLRAFTICSRLAHEDEADSLPGRVSGSDILDVLCQESEAPAFMKDK